MDDTPYTDKALALVGEQPWPDDIAEQLEALEEKAAGLDLERFAYVWEAFIAAGGE